MDLPDLEPKFDVIRAEFANVFEKLQFSEQQQEAFIQIFGLLGVEQPSDLEYIFERDLLDKGMKLIPARKLLAYCNESRGVVSNPTGPTTTMTSAPIQVVSRNRRNTLTRSSAQRELAPKSPQNQNLLQTCHTLEQGIHCLSNFVSDIRCSIPNIDTSNTNDLRMSRLNVLVLEDELMDKVMSCTVKLSESYQQIKSALDNEVATNEANHLKITHSGSGISGKPQRSRSKNRSERSSSSGSRRRAATVSAASSKSRERKRKQVQINQGTDLPLIFGELDGFNTPLEPIENIGSTSLNTSTDNQLTPENDSTCNDVGGQEVIKKTKFRRNSSDYVTTAPNSLLFSPPPEYDSTIVPSCSLMEYDVVIGDKESPLEVLYYICGLSAQLNDKIGGAICPATSQVEKVGEKTFQLKIKWALPMDNFAMPGAPDPNELAVWLLEVLPPVNPDEMSARKGIFVDLDMSIFRTLSEHAINAHTVKTETTP